MTRWRTTVIVGALAVAACGSETPPTPEGLATHLVTTGTYRDVDTGTWTDNAPPEAADGVVPDEFQEMLPRMEPCEAATVESRREILEIPWMAFRQLDLATDDPIQPPDDRVGHLVFVQEFLLAGEPDELAGRFELLRAGGTACLGEIPAGEEGPGEATEMVLPEIGDDRFGVLLTVEEAGGWAEWRMHEVLVRDGDVLMLLSVTDIRAGTDPLFTVDEVGEMARTALELL